MLIALGKTFGILFPFVKEIFLGKPSNQRKKKPVQKNTMLKQIIIALGIVSFLCCIFLFNIIRNYSSENKKLRQEISTHKGTVEKKPAEAHVEPVQPVDPPIPTPPYLPATEPVTAPTRPRKKQRNSETTPNKNEHTHHQDEPIDDETSKRKLIDSLRNSDLIQGQ